MFPGDRFDAIEDDVRGRVRGFIETMLEERRVRRALNSVFGGEVSKDVVSRTWRKVKGDFEAWNNRPLTDKTIVRLILDGTVARVRLGRKATSISLLVALGVREDGQKVPLSIRNMGGESEAAWRALLDDMVKRGLKTPGLVLPAFAGTDGSPGLDAALVAPWGDVPVQRRTVHKYRNLLAQPKRKCFRSLRIRLWIAPQSLHGHGWRVLWLREWVMRPV